MVLPWLWAYTIHAGIFLCFRSTAFLQPLLGLRMTWRTVTDSFFPHLVEFLLSCWHEFLVQGFSLCNLLSFWTLPRKRSINLCSYNLQNLSEISIVIPCRTEPGRASVGFLLRDSHQWTNFIALISILNNFFSLTFKHGSFNIMPSFLFCCSDMDFMLWELHALTFKIKSFLSECIQPSMPTKQNIRSLSRLLFLSRI